jgi:RNA polymerase sigma-70 factor (ECF subfamily)
MQQKEQIEQFLVLIREQERLIYKVCSIYSTDTEDRKDLFQEIILQAWTAFPRFQNASKISTWLYRVALNTAINHERKSKKKLTIPFPGLLNNIEDRLTPGYVEEYKILQQLIATLPALEKALILLYFEDRPHQEIAEIMGISVSNVGTRLGRIKDKLKKLAQPYITT